VLGSNGTMRRILVFWSTETVAFLCDKRGWLLQICLFLETNHAEKRRRWPPLDFSEEDKVPSRIQPTAWRLNTILTEHFIPRVRPEENTTAIFTTATDCLTTGYDICRALLCYKTGKLGSDDTENLKTTVIMQPLIWKPVRIYGKNDKHNKQETRKWV